MMQYFGLNVDTNATALTSLGSSPFALFSFHNFYPDQRGGGSGEFGGGLDVVHCWCGGSARVGVGVVRGGLGVVRG